MLIWIHILPKSILGHYCRSFMQASS